MRPGRLLRGAYRLLRGAQLTTYRVDRVLTELALAAHDPALERFALDLHYARNRTYVANQAAGLFPFETRIVRAYFPMPPARVLVPGAGGGREMVALLSAGYRVEGFDPVPRYVEAAREAIAAWPESRCERASIQDWSSHPTGTFDAIFGGWGFWAHVLAQSDRLAALEAFRTVCPVGPVFLSFFRGEELLDAAEHTPALEPLHPTPSHPVERVIRHGLRERVLRRAPLERGTGFRNGIYFHLTTEAEMVEEAGRAGYRVAYYEHDGSKYPHAVLVPADRPR